MFNILIVDDEAGARKTFGNILKAKGYDVDSVGTGAEATTGKSVTVNYTGTLTDGTVFDSNTDPKFGHVTPFTFNLGTPSM